MCVYANHFVGVIFYEDFSGRLGVRTTLKLSFWPTVKCNGTEQSLADCTIQERGPNYSGSSGYWIGCQRTCKSQLSFIPYLTVRKVDQFIHNNMCIIYDILLLLLLFNRHPK